MESLLNPSQIISHFLHIAVTALGAFLVVHGSLSPTVAEQVAQIAGGVVLALGASAMHSLRVWVDANPKLVAIRGIADTIDTAIGEAQTTTQTTTTTGPVSGKPLFQQVVSDMANGTKS